MTLHLPISDNFYFGGDFGRKLRKIAKESFSIANTKVPMATSYQNLNKIGQKLRPLKCHIGKFKMAADEVIKLRYRKSEKNDTGPCHRDYLCAISSKSAQPFRL